MTDHKAEAERLIQYAGKTGSESAATSAAAYATLYLAEQQRIANLIAYHAAPGYIKEVHDALLGGD